MGEFEAAVVVLQVPELDSSRRSPTLARLRFAYAEALKAAKRHQEADTWRSRAISEDPDGTAGVNELDDDLEVIDLEEYDDEDSDTSEGQDDQDNAPRDSDVDDADDDLDDLDDEDEDDLDDDVRDHADADDDADDEDLDEDDDEDLDDDEDDLDDDQAVAGSQDEAVAAKAEAKDGDDTGAKAGGAKSSPLEMRFYDGAREDADKGADRE